MLARYAVIMSVRLSICDSRRNSNGSPSTGPQIEVGVGSDRRFLPISRYIS